MPADDLVEVVDRFWLLMVVTALLALGAAAALLLAIGLRRAGLPEARLGTLLGLSIAAVVFCAVGIMFSGFPASEAAELRVRTEPCPRFGCTGAGQVTSILIPMLGTPVLGIGALLGAWLPTHQRFGPRLLWVLVATAAPVVTFWVSSLPLFSITS